MTPRTTGLLLLLATSINWGATWPLMKFIMTGLPPLTLRAWGAGVAALALIALALALRVPLAVPRGQRGWLALYALLNVSAWMAFTTLGLHWLSASEGAILAYTFPIWTTLLSWPLLGERPALPRVGALVLGFGSMLALFAGRGTEVGLAKLPGLGFVLTAAVLFALATVLTKRRPLSLPPLASLTWQMAIGAVPMLALAPFVERPEIAEVTWQVWFAFGWMIVFSMNLSYFTWFAALRRLPASTATLGSLLAPVLGVMGAAVVLGEPVGLREVAALAGVLLAVGLALQQKERRP